MIRKKILQGNCITNNKINYNKRGCMNVSNESNVFFDNLPNEVKTYILGFVEKPGTTTLVSKEWLELTDATFLNIFKSYENSPPLKSYVQRVKNLESNKGKVKVIYDTLLKKAEALG